MPTTQDFPYTMPYVRELLQLEQSTLDTYIHELGIVTERDPVTRQQVLTLRDINLIKRAMMMESKYGKKSYASPQSMMTEPADSNVATEYDESIEIETPHVALRENLPVVRAVQISDQHEVNVVQKSQTSSPPVQESEKMTTRLTKATQEYTASNQHVSDHQLAKLVDSVSSAKESMVTEFNRMLDSKLSGLDSIVVELIRAKSENELLKRELEILDDENYELKQELASFNEVSFGFYRKEH